ncbi:hypothetical protein KUCAC02_001696, partial [Chaenocephalus aceratus]
IEHQAELNNCQTPRHHPNREEISSKKEGREHFSREGELKYFNAASHYRGRSDTVFGQGELKEPLSAKEFKKQLEQSFPCRRHGESIYTPVIGNRGTCQDSMWIYSPTTTSGTHNLCREAKALEEPPTAPHMPDSELEESYYFALSLVPMLQRLDKDRKHQAK